MNQFVLPVQCSGNAIAKQTSKTLGIRTAGRCQSTGFDSRNSGNCLMTGGCSISENLLFRTLSSCISKAIGDDFFRINAVFES